MSQFEIGKSFIEKTKYKYLNKSDQNKKYPQPPLEQPYDKTKTPIQLPKNFVTQNYSLKDCIENRKSIRNYDNKPLTLEELSWLLWSTQGIKETMNRVYTLRVVPSAGARHAFETYLLINNVETLKEGLYRYIASKHSLIDINLDPDIAEKLTKAAYNQSMVEKSAVTFIWVAVAYRMCWRYGERGYRYLLLDAGHVCQNLYLAAEDVDCGVCAIGAFHDDEINNILEVDGENLFVIYLATVGKKR
ncbi:MAG: SagB/ThcOx family dehydrogenase [Candidatus Heimdallarchaeaceae archaeon]